MDRQDGKILCRELPELLDPVIDGGAPVVGPPGGERVDPLPVGQHVGGVGGLVGVELEGVRIGLGPRHRPSSDSSRRPGFLGW